MKKITAVLLATATVVSSTVAAAAPSGMSGGATQVAHLQPVMASSVHMLDPIELETTRAGIAPLALALGIASFDLALAGFFWGVYVPNYAPRNPSFYTEVFSN